MTRVAPHGPARCYVMMMSSRCPLSLRECPSSYCPSQAPPCICIQPAFTCLYNITMFSFITRHSIIQDAREASCKKQRRTSRAQTQAHTLDTRVRTNLEPHQNGGETRTRTMRYVNRRAPKDASRAVCCTWVRQSVGAGDKSQRELDPKPAAGKRVEPLGTCARRAVCAPFRMRAS